MRTPILATMAVLLVGLFAGLGQWQLKRAEEHTARARLFANGAALPALTALPDAPLGDEHRYRRVDLAGRYMPEIQVLLDNMTHAGVVGFEVLTPFTPADSGSAVVVNRGFVPGSPDRSRLPGVATGGGERRVRGYLDALPVPALRLAAEAQTQTGPVRVLSFPTAAELERELERALVPYQVVLDAGDGDAYLHAAGPVDRSADRNLAYAWQWFLLAAATAAGAIGAVVRARLRQGPS